MNSDIVIVDGELLKETVSAYLIGYGDIQAWVPKSLIELEAITGTAITIEIPQWLAEEKELV